MSKKDLYCPGCNRLISFKNVMVFEDKEIKIIGIGYVLQCLKCKAVFVPAMRTSEDATNKQMKSISKQLNDKLKSIQKA